MPAEPGRVDERGPARETRLLILTLVISAVVLVLLAQFRFPDRAQRPAAPPATALDELAMRGAYEAQAAALRDLARRLDGSLVLLRGRPAPRSSAPAPDFVLFTGLRIRDELAMAGLPDRLDRWPDAVEVLAESKWVPAGIVGTDDPRGLVVVRIPAQPAPVLIVGSQAPRAPGYFAAAVGTPAGPGLSPVWLEAVASVGRTAWNGPVWALPPNGAPSSGTPLYSIDGVFVGLVADGLDGRLLVPGALALSAAGELATGRSLTGTDAGFDVVDLATPALRAAAGRADGVLVGWVDPDGPSNGQLQTGDVVIAVDADPVRVSSDFHRALARREPGTRATFSVVRDGQNPFISIVLRIPPRLAARAAQRTSPDAGPSPGLGLTLREGRAAVTVVSVDPRGAAAGLLAPGDRITWVRGHTEPTSSGITRDFASLPSGGALLFRVAPNSTGVDRRAAPGTAERMVAVLKP